ncbi:zinc finger protein 12-like [Diorhabda carinulata]|uniref:zinc finger protein 12-like n=1 Tax=Diorhabda carinulata TaxID=1163345 RepID=UPI0025A05503|nr:zinc finger protein 12-like [Diorhabda carinulata]
MEEEKDNFDWICRACLEKSTKMYSLTGSIVNLEVNIAAMLEFCTSQKLVLSEDLPNNVCLSCFKTIRIAYRFFKQFYEVQQQLMNLKDSDGSFEEETLLFEVETTPPDKEENGDPVKSDEEHEVEFIIKQEDSIEEDSSQSTINNDTQLNSMVEIKDEYIEEDANFSQILNLQGVESKIEFIVDETKNSESIEKRERYICPICGQKFIRAELFRAHITSYNLSKITCTRCPTKPEYDLTEYFYHYRHFHKYHCDICDKRLVSSYGYYYHKKQHENIKLYKCSFQNCSKSFTMKHLLTKHENSHHSTKIYNCKLCRATFNTNDSLRYHLKVHDNKKDHLCTACGKAFFQAVHLRDHMYRHLGYKKFVCDICGKSFVTNSSLKKHIIYCTKKHGLDVN